MSSFRVFSAFETHRSSALGGLAAAVSLFNEGHVQRRDRVLDAGENERDVQLIVTRDAPVAR